MSRLIPNPRRDLPPEDGVDVDPVVTVVGCPVLAVAVPALVLDPGLVVWPIVELDTDPVSTPGMVLE